MLALLGRMVTLFNREEKIAYRYNRAHPHFKWFLALDAVLSSLLIFGGVAFASQPSSNLRTAQMGHAGVIPMSSASLIEHVRSDEMFAYWLGPIAGYEYAPNCKATQAMVINYLVKGSDMNGSNQPNITVQTFDNSMVYKMELHSLGSPSSATTVAFAGTTVKFDADAMNHEIVTFKNKPEIVVISYPTSQPTAAMMKNAEALRLIS